MTALDLNGIRERVDTCFFVTDARVPFQGSAPRELPSLFDGDDHALGLVERKKYITINGRVAPAAYRPTEEGKPE